MNCCIQQKITRTFQTMKLGLLVQALHPTHRLLAPYLVTFFLQSSFHNYFKAKFYLICFPSITTESQSSKPVCIDGLSLGFKPLHVISVHTVHCTATMLQHSTRGL